MIFKCKYCRLLIEFDESEFDCGGDSHPDGEELLWGHIQLEHENVFKEVQDLETPFMIEECYKRIN